MHGKQSMSGQYACYWNAFLLPLANEVWGKVICLQVCACPQGGVWSQGVLGPGGVPARGTWSWDGAWSQWEGCLVLGGAWWRPPQRLLLRAVRILLECILIIEMFTERSLNLRFQLPLTCSISSHLPHGPAALSPARGLKGCITAATILIQMGTWPFLSKSGGFSGNPHGSARTKWCKRLGYRIAYADAKYPPKL